MRGFELCLYTSQTCHLCELAAALLQPFVEQLGLTLYKVDINTDANLITDYGLRIPVLLLPNGVEKGWPFTTAQVRRLLAEL